MAVPFPSEAWMKSLQAEVNASQPYAEAAKNWEGDFQFVVRGEAGQPDTALYMDLWHGECRAAYLVATPLPRPPEFEIEAPLATWRKVIEGRLDPIQGLVTRQLKLRGQLVKVLRAPRAAMELVKCCTRVETAWPEPEHVVFQ